ncbi:hypothetical protein Ctob_014597 [Chrysochromulina tobinii]|uniref:Uncharacterized protein n=1 Tax=Chrysochromulina tobinii TaxID=1460289 RepID=A0A0M0JU03_9EUKA|nr:hypothetical protein Ctob_014597 [Chrysochromulina tobinii]|eukprot:KOO30029.1 hypothetical protein Ctob_014597 [Chrysochromulina sp. CCMP291]
MDEDYGTATATAASPLGRTFASAVAALPDYQYIDGLTASEDDEDERRASMEAPRSPLKVSTGDEGAPRSPPKSRTPVSPGRYDYEEEVHDQIERPPAEGISPKTAPQGRSFPRESLDTFTASPVGEGMPPPKTARDKERHTRPTTGAPYVPAEPADELTSADTARLEELSALLVQLDALRTQTEESLKASAPPKRKKLTEAQMRQASNELSRALGGM